MAGTGQWMNGLRDDAEEGDPRRGVDQAPLPMDGLSFINV